SSPMFSSTTSSAGFLFLDLACSPARLRYDTARIVQHAFARIPSVHLHHERAFHENLAGLCAAFLARERLGLLPVHAFSSAEKLAQGPMAAHSRRTRGAQPPPETRFG